MVGWVGCKQSALRSSSRLSDTTPCLELGSHYLLHWARGHWAVGRLAVSSLHDRPCKTNPKLTRTYSVNLFFLSSPLFAGIKIFVVVLSTRESQRERQTKPFDYAWTGRYSFKDHPRLIPPPLKRKGTFKNFIRPNYPTITEVSGILQMPRNYNEIGIWLSERETGIFTGKQNAIEFWCGQGRAGNSYLTRIRKTQKPKKRKLSLGRRRKWPTFLDPLQ